jgi:hypothetical protein
MKLKMMTAAIAVVAMAGCGAVMQSTRNGAALENVAASSPALFNAKSSFVSVAPRTVAARLDRFADACFNNSGIGITGRNGTQTINFAARVETIEGVTRFVVFQEMASGFAHVSEATKGFNAFSSTRITGSGSGTALTTTEAKLVRSQHALITAVASGEATGCADMTRYVVGL